MLIPNRSSARAPFRLLLVGLWLALVVVSLVPATFGRAQSSDGAVYIVQISGTIDLGLAPYLERVLNEAEEANAAAVILEIDTPGGRLDAVLQMKDALLGTSVRTVAFVNRTAFSAGALVAIASREIYMTSGAVMGAATPIDGASGETSSEKVVSAVRSTFRSTAEATGRDPLIAEAMVDPEVEVPGLSPRGQLLTLTTNDALQWGYADAVIETRAALISHLGLSGAEIVEPSMRFAERAARFITDPVFSGLLLTLGLLLIIGDFFADGLGLMALAGLGLIATFFWGHMVAGLAGWEDLVLVLIGLALIAVELFVLPGFGIPGILGLIALLGGLFLAMLGRDIRTPEQIERALLTLVAVVVFFVLGVVILLALLPRRTRFGGTVLRSTVTDGPESRARQPVGWLKWFGGQEPLAAATGAGQVTIDAVTEQSLTGRRGRAMTPLRPSGTAEIDGEPVDVVAETDFIDQGEPIVIVLDQGYRRVVRRVAAE